jgi:predicted CDP-diglyceride synthetase/phosphatidate cytidylyltransferase
LEFSYILILISHFHIFYYPIYTFSYLHHHPKVVWKISLFSNKTAHCTFVVMLYVKCTFVCNVVCTIKNLSILTPQNRTKQNLNYKKNYILYHISCYFLLKGSDNIYTVNNTSGSRKLPNFCSWYSTLTISTKTRFEWEYLTVLASVSCCCLYI